MIEDIVSRLRAWVHSVDAVPASDLMDEAASEIEQLRSLRDSDGQVMGTLIGECQEMRSLCANGRYLTDQERDALINAAMLCMESSRRARKAGHTAELCDRFDVFANTLRNLNARLTKEPQE